MAKKSFMIRDLHDFDENDNFLPFKSSPLPTPVLPTQPRAPFQALNWNFQFPAPFPLGFLPTLPLFNVAPFAPSFPPTVSPFGPVPLPTIPFNVTPMSAPSFAPNFLGPAPSLIRPNVVDYTPRPPNLKELKELDFKFFIKKCSYISVPRGFITAIAKRCNKKVTSLNNHFARHRAQHKIKPLSLVAEQKHQMSEALLNHPTISLEDLAEKVKLDKKVVNAWWIADWVLHGKHA